MLDAVNCDALLKIAKVHRPASQSDGPVKAGPRVWTGQPGPIQWRANKGVSESRVAKKIFGAVDISLILSGETDGVYCTLTESKPRSTHRDATRALLLRAPKSQQRMGYYFTVETFLTLVLIPRKPDIVGF